MEILGDLKAIKFVIKYKKIELQLGEANPYYISVEAFK
jgi:hypothetical protein